MQISAATLTTFKNLLNKKSILQTRPMQTMPSLKGLTVDTFIKTAEKSYTPDEIQKAIKTYTQTNGINETLRMGKDYFKESIATLDYGISHSEPLGKKVTGYRGLKAIKGDITEEQVQNFMNNNKGYTSIAKDKSVANYFKDTSAGKGAMIEIELGEDTKALQTGYEYVIGRNSQWDIQKINPQLYKAKFIGYKN